MARKVKFPLKMADGASVRDPDELKMHFDLLSVLEYYANGKLAEWLDNCLYTHEAQAVRALDSLAEDFSQKLCDILGVAYTEQDGSAILEKVSDRNKRLAKLRQYTDDENTLAAADYVVFSQEELVKLLDREPGIKVIYLCGERFAIPADWKEITYVGVNHPQVYIREGLKGVAVEQAEVSSDLRAFKAEQLWFDLAEQDSAIAQNELGNCLGTMGNDGEAFQWYMKAAAQGCDKGQYNLAVCYRDGAGVGKDREEAFQWFLKAAEQGHGLAQYNLAVCYRDGDGVDKDPEETFQWFLKAAEQGVADAQNQVGFYYYQHRNAKENREKAVSWFIKAARQGHAWAQYSLAKCYRDGDGVDEDQREAFRWFLKAAEQGHKYAQREVSTCYSRGRGVEQDQEKSSAWSMKALKQDAVSLAVKVLTKASRQ